MWKQIYFHVVKNQNETNKHNNENPCIQWLPVIVQQVYSTQKIMIPRNNPNRQLLTFSLCSQTGQSENIHICFWLSRKKLLVVPSELFSLELLIAMYLYSVNLSYYYISMNLCKNVVKLSYTQLTSFRQCLICNDNPMLIYH